MNNKELHTDVIEELEEKESKAKNLNEMGKISKKGHKRVLKSIGFYQPSTEYFRKCDEKGKSWDGAEVIEKQIWDVNMEDSVFTTESQEIAEILSFLVQIDFRLRRIEKEE